MTDKEYYAKAYQLTLLYPDQFRPGFADWLWDNLSIQRTFDREASAIAASGRSHYSPYTIVEYIRHWTLLHDANSGFKVDQNWGSSMARLFVHMNPQHANLFRTKQEPRCLLAPLAF